ncbi:MULTISPECIES: LytTR family DNA-binding domain-containing protein [Chryseobacterium]|jgi:Response regulator of the LytR/AlgR family|uniref:DNA-binding LytR/AlgR family response regulator n=1 Tax=Chryseobacterium rhizosphaerae TaxID=395937 RepID=A0AAE3YB71_9FLAO|nr:MULTISPECIES: LytTR family DNA-binding domain-containing protein [Chryseobacterium]MBL3549322.1 response regulator transcription factor [Chryseobacterium sp. KMC2]MCQ9634740.1 LytTR family DNA-binding domain-containing protein [Chryseobacterium sp. WG23]MDR6527332.1 DNA-binding LytR/AlgR family response regulator [Chryseobacterium rhizosphaerae]MDR6547238.1 DNA-binding LytR/AlgR family response regulator [Chryseobacterium rhizosphaerae]REC78987.1 DNA-binding response regulator [Chryseobacte
MANLTIVSVDDEYPALELIRHYCERMEDVDLLEVFQNPQDALEYLKENRVDLVILDINMPYINGIELLLQLPYKPLCIFLTLETQYAVKAFELDVVHYLVKPVDFETFRKAVTKAKDFLQFKKSTEDQKKEDFIMFKSNYIMNKVLLEDIKWIQGFGEYIILITHLKKYMILERMSNFEEKFQNLGFIRIHKSYIVLSSHISSYDTANVYLKDGEKLPLGRTYKNSLKAYLN